MKSEKKRKMFIRVVCLVTAVVMMLTVFSGVVFTLAAAV